MQFEPNTIYHIYNQGNNRQQIFYKEENYIYFLRKMRKQLLPHVEFLAYCLMPNHFHWLVLTKESACLPSNSLKAGHRKSSGDSKSPDDYYIQNLSNSIAILLRSYTRAINKQEDKSGSLFRGKTKAKNGIIDGFITVNGKNKDLFFRADNHYARVCFEYIHNNPVEAKLCLEQTDWRYSSAVDYAGLRNGSLCNQELAKKLIFGE
ncbi:MAG: transposase [Saprospiraceae bacterium]